MTTLAQTLKVWEDVQVKLERTVACHKGLPLSVRDNRSYAAALAQLGCLLSDLRNSVRLIGSDREIIGCLCFLHSSDVSDVANWLGECLVQLRLTAEPRTLEEFKRSLPGVPVGSLMAPVRRVLEDFLTLPGPSSFAVLSQFLSYLTRLSLKDISIDLESEYWELESRLETLTLPGSLVKSLNGIIREWFADFRWRPISPHHGPGATAELSRSCTLEEKFAALATDQVLDYALDKYLGGRSALWPLDPGKLSRVSVAVSVAKSMKTKRLICKESAGLMWIQQGMKDQTVDFVHGHDFLQHHLTFENQSPNGELALRGSFDGSFATIDLSAASDCVTTDLVKEMFRGTALIVPFLAARSREVTFDGKRSKRVTKFAPMGSALCFPVESLIFAAIVEHAVRRARVGLGSFPVWRVYGDDIVVADALFEDVVLILEAVGFTINRSKSYSSPSRFRESCGVEGYDGVDVTPLRISRNFYCPERGELLHHPALFAALQRHSNMALERHLPVLRAFLLRMIFDGGHVVPLFSQDPNVGIASPWPDNYRAARRWSDFPLNKGDRLHRVEYRVHTLGTKSVSSADSRLDESGLLYEWLRLSQDRIQEYDRYRLWRGPNLPIEALRLVKDGVSDPDSRITVLRGSQKLTVKRTWVCPWTQFTVASPSE